jgi:hypothetical protein
MNKLLVILAIAVTMVIAKPVHKGGKPLNKGSVHSSLKGANSVVKPNKYKHKNKYKKNNSILNLDKKNNKLEKEVTKSVIKAIL